MVISTMPKNLGVIANKMKSNPKVLFEFLKGVMSCRLADADWLYFLMNIWCSVLINTVNKYTDIRIYTHVVYSNTFKDKC